MDDFERKLTKLEKQVPQRKSSDEIANKKANRHLIFLWSAAIAQYVGNAQEGESLADALSRALGYPRSADWQAAALERQPEYYERMRLAGEALLKKFSDDDPFDKLLERMEAGLCDHFKRGLDNYSK